MTIISDYEGKLLSHLQGFYRPEDHDLAVELMEALGLACVEVPTSGDHSLTRVHVNSGDRSNVDNVMFLSAMPGHQAKLEDILRDRMVNDGELRDAVTLYRNVARTNGDGSPHFGIHYPANADLERAMDAVRSQLSQKLTERVSMKEMPPYGAVADFPDMRQVFIHTDVFAFGSTTLGQTIELQVERSALNIGCEAV
jgi:hypothetical protein